MNNLFEALINQRETPSEFQIATIIHELLLSLHFIHSKGLVHKDL